MCRNYPQYPGVGPANLRADALRGVLAWPLARLQGTPIGDLMARIIGDVEVLGVGVREFTIELWDTVLFSLSFIVAMLLIDAGLTLWVLLPVPAALVLGWASGRWVGARTTAARQASAGLTALLQEQLAGIRVLPATPGARWPPLTHHRFYHPYLAEAPTESAARVDPGSHGTRGA